MEHQRYQVTSPEHAIAHFDSQGFYLVPKLFNQREIESIKPTIDLFHQNWQADNFEFYQYRSFGLL